ncbi:MAG TPA: hypothetical protein VGF76_22630 [Polyangiaceae bacterium]
MTPSLRTVDVRRFAALRLSLILPLMVGCAHAVYDNQPGDQTTGSVSDPTASAGSLSSNVASSLPSEMDPDASAAGSPGTSDAGGAPSTASDGGGTNSAGLAGSSTAGAAAGGSLGMSSNGGGAGTPATAGSGGSTTTGGAGAPPASAGAASGGASAGASSGGTTSGGSSSAGASNAGSSSAGAASAGAPGNSCANVATWKLNTYSAGDLVQSGGKLYKCKEYPYTGWCGTSDAYQPTSGFAWMDAWDLVGPC